MFYTSINENYDSETSKKLFTYAIVFSMFLNVYKIYNFGLGEILFFFLSPYFLLKSNNLKRIGNIGIFYILYVLYCVIITFIYILFLENSNITTPIFRLLRNGFYVFLVFYLGNTFFSIKHAIRFFKYFALILALVIIFQYLAFNLFGYYYSCLIEGLSISSIDAAEIENNTLQWIRYTGYFRPNGFFSEPAHCSYVLSLATLIELIPFNNYYNRFKNYFVSIYILALVLTMSGNAFILLGVVIGLSFIFSKKLSLLEIVLITVCVFCILYIAYLYIPYMETLVYRFSTIGDATTNSVGVRLLRGPAFFYNLPFTSQVFGIGFGNFIAVREFFNIWTIFEIPKEYVSSNWDYLISTGIFGAVYLLTLAYLKLKNSQDINKCIFLLAFIIGLSASFSHSMIWAVYMCFAFSESENQYCV